MTRTGASIAVVACTVAAAAAGQAPSQPSTFKVAVDAITIDAVVTDRKGAIVRDLTAADFEVLQDGKKQKITYAQFVPVATPARPAAGTAGRAAVPPGAPPAPVPPLVREQVARTIVILVDDLGISFAGLNDIRRGLRGFVTTGLVPTDLVAIVRTGDLRGMARALTNDRAALLASIDALRFNVLSRKGVWSSEDVTQVGGAPPEVVEPVSGAQRYISNKASLAALGFVVQAARELPGRKMVVVATEGFDNVVANDTDSDTRVRSAIDRVIDQAVRSGVVIYTLAAQGLQAGGLRASDDLHRTAESNNPMVNTDPDAMGRMVRGMAEDRRREVRNAEVSLEYLAEQTGRFAVARTNDLAGGLIRISDDVRDYYVIGYEPEPGTFAPDGKTAALHTIDVKVRRPGVSARTRKEFIGVVDPPAPATPPTPAQQLLRAATSPFSAAAIGLHATNLPGYSPDRGLFIRTVLHLDAQALTFAPDARGARTASADLIGLVFDSDGVQVDVIGTGFDLTLPDAAADQDLKDGLVYTTRVPIAKPGGYQLRYALRDRRSGAIGTVGGFVSVPDVAGGAFALSGLVLRAGEPGDETEPIDSDRFDVPPADALRVFASGTPLSYSYEIYNAAPTVQAVATLWRGTDKITTLPAETLTRPADGATFAVSGALELAADLPSGAYVLQIAATSDDPKQVKKSRATVQRISFDIK